MKRYSTALLICTLSLAGQLAHADMIDDAIGRPLMMLIIRAIAGLTMMMGAIRTAASRAPIASGSMTTGGGSLRIADANLTSASASLIGTAVSWKATSAGWMMIIDTARPAAFAAPA